jgi:hypothetical protein
MKKTVIAFMLAATAVLLLAGCAAREEKAAHSDIKGKTITIATGEFFEACDNWTPGDRINFMFTSSKPVLFNVHYHAKHKKEYAIKDVVVDDFSGSFIVQTDDIHCCLWKNDNPKFITLTYDMSVEKQ